MPKNMNDFYKSRTWTWIKLLGVFISGIASYGLIFLNTRHYLPAHSVLLDVLPMLIWFLIAGAISWRHGSDDSQNIQKVGIIGLPMVFGYFTAFYGSIYSLIQKSSNLFIMMSGTTALLYIISWAALISFAKQHQYTIPWKVIIKMIGGIFLSALIAGLVSFIFRDSEIKNAIGPIVFITGSGIFFSMNKKYLRTGASDRVYLTFLKILTNVIAATIISAAITIFIGILMFQQGYL